MQPQHYWEPRAAVIKPHLFDATLAPYGIRFRLAPTMHGAILHTTFPTGGGDRYVCFAEADWTRVEANIIEGVSRRVSQDKLPVGSFHFYIRINSDESSSFHKAGGLACFRYPDSVAEVTVRIGTSLISAEYAAASLTREIPSSKTFQDIADESRLIWNKRLKKVDVLDAGELSEYSSKHLSVFYTGLYRYN